MASSKVVATNPDLPRQSSTCSLSTLIGDLQQSEPSKNAVGSVGMDDFLKSLYSTSETNPTHFDTEQNFNSGAGGGEFKGMAGGGGKTVEEVWKVIVGGDQRRVVAEEAGFEEMTLEDFLTKAGAVREEDVRGAGSVVKGTVSSGVSLTGVAATAAMSGGEFSLVPVPAVGVEGSSLMGFGNGIDGSGGGVRGGRGRRRAVQEPLDKATQLKQRRMIKNRESAARSRERKQVHPQLLPFVEKELVG